MKYLVLLMFIMPFVIVLLRITLWGKSAKDHVKQFFSDSAPGKTDSAKTLICIGDSGNCPIVDGVKPIVLTGTMTEQHAKFLAILLQLKSDSVVAVSCPSPYHADVNAALQSFTFSKVIVV
jgi:hypothetical protein